MHLELFEPLRPLLFGIAYRMLGSQSEAEDILQDVYIKFMQKNLAQIEDVRKFLVTIVSRSCIDTYKAARNKRVQYKGVWLPEPLLIDSIHDPENLLQQDEKISLALLHLLEKLNAIERAVYILRDVFDYEYEEIATIVGKSEVACRKTNSRSRAKLARDESKYRVESKQLQTLLITFLRAARNGDLEQLVSHMKDDIILYTDGGGQVKAAIKPIYGKDKVSRFLIGVSKKPRALNSFPFFCFLNGKMSVLLYEKGRPSNAITFEVDQEGVSHIYSISNPEKLQHLAKQRLTFWQRLKTFFQVLKG